MEPTPKHSPAKRNFILMTMLMCVVVGVSLYANRWKDDRRIAETVVEGNAIVDTRDILALARVPVNAPLFSIDLFAIEQRVMKNPFIKSVSVRRDVPNRVRIKVEERTPVAVLPADRVYYVDAEGVILPPARSQAIFDVPVLAGIVPADELVAGKRSTRKTLHDALYFLSLAQEIDENLYRNISEIRLTVAGDFMFFTAEFGVPVLVGKEQFGPRLVKFDGFWASVVARNGAARLQQVDLRFEEQIVVRWHHAPA